MKFLKATATLVGLSTSGVDALTFESSSLTICEITSKVFDFTASKCSLIKNDAGKTLTNGVSALVSALGIVILTVAMTVGSIIMSGLRAALIVADSALISSLEAAVVTLFGLCSAFLFSMFKSFKSPKNPLTDIPADQCESEATKQDRPNNKRKLRERPNHEAEADEDERSNQSEYDSETDREERSEESSSNSETDEECEGEEVKLRVLYFNARSVNPRRGSPSKELKLNFMSAII